MTLREVNRVGEGQKNVPKLRFKGYEDAWEQRKLGEFCDMFNGDRSSKYPNASDMLPEGIPFINAGDLQEGRVNLETCNKISKSKYDELSGAKLSEGDIVYCLRGSLGKNAYIDNFSEGTIASSLVAIRPKMINGRFLFHILNSDIEYKQRVLRDEGAAQPNLSAKSLSEFFIPIPEAEEDQSVADFLDNVDNYITLHQRKYDALKSMKKTLLSKMFPKNGEDVPEIRFKGFTDAWEQRKLGTIAESTYGGGTPKTTIEEYWDGGIPWIQSSDIQENQFFNIQVRKTISEGGLANSAAKLIPKNSIAIVTRVGVGKLGLIPFDFTTSQDFLSLSELNIDSHYAVYLLFKKLQFESKMVQGTSIKGITKEELLSKDLKISQSDLEQKYIGKFFRKIDNIITLHQRKLDELKNMKKTLLQQMFV